MYVRSRRWRNRARCQASNVELMSLQTAKCGDGSNMGPSWGPPFSFRFCRFLIFGAPHHLDALAPLASWRTGSNAHLGGEGHVSRNILHPWSCFTWIFSVPCRPSVPRSWVDFIYITRRSLSSAPVSLFLRSPGLGSHISFLLKTDLATSQFRRQLRELRNTAIHIHPPLLLPAASLRIFSRCRPVP